MRMLNNAELQLQSFKYKARIVLFGCEKKGGRPLSVERRNALEKASPGSTCAVKGARGQTLYYKKTGAKAAPGAKTANAKGKAVKKSPKATKIAKAAKAAHITKQKPVAKAKKETAPKKEKEPKKKTTPKPKKEIAPKPKKEIAPKPKKEIAPKPKKEIAPKPKKEIAPKPKKEIAPKKEKAPKTLVERRPKDLKGLDAIKWHLEEIKKNPEFQKTLKEHPALFHSLFESAEIFHKPPTKELTEENLAKDFRYFMQMYMRENPQAQGRATIPVIHDLLRESGYNLTTKEFHTFLQKWSREEKVYLETCDSPGLIARSNEGISTERGVLLYVLNKNAWEKLTQQEGKSYPEYKGDYFIKHNGGRIHPSSKASKETEKTRPQQKQQEQKERPPQTQVENPPQTQVENPFEKEHRKLKEEAEQYKKKEKTPPPKPKIDWDELARKADEEVKTPWGRIKRGFKNVVGID